LFIHHIYEKLCDVQEEACQLGLISLLLEIFYIKMQMQSIRQSAEKHARVLQREIQLVARSFGPAHANDNELAIFVGF
jgi:hypothetical protein